MGSRGCAVLLLLFLGGAAQAELPQEVTKSASTTTQSSGIWSRFTADLHYGASTDLADDATPRAFEHDVRGDLSFSLGQGYSLRALGNLYYSSLGREVLVEDENNPIGGDIDLSLSKRFVLGSFAAGEHSMRFALRNTLPANDDKRYEGIRSIPGAEVSMSSGFLDSAVTLLNIFSYRYIVNTYRFSPTSGELGRKDSLTYTLWPIFKIVGNLTGSLGFGVKLSRRLDNSVDYNYNNFASLDYDFGKLSLGLQVENGGFTREGDISLWYVDQYRRILSGSLTYSF